MSELVSDTPSNPDWKLTISWICFVLIFSVRARYKISPGSRSPERVLIGTPAVKHLIQDADRRFSMLANEISTGRQTGMIAMDQSLEDLWRRGVIARSEALRAAFNPGALEPRLRRAA